MDLDLPWPEDVPVVPMWPLVGHDVYRMSRPKAYYLAQRGEFPCPVFRVGERWMVLTVELRRALGLPVERLSRDAPRTPGRRASMTPQPPIIPFIGPSGPSGAAV